MSLSFIQQGPFVQVKDTDQLDLVEHCRITFEVIVAWQERIDSVTISVSYSIVDLVSCAKNICNKRLSTRLQRASEHIRQLTS